MNAIVITGAARGIGRAIVKRCIEDGYFVFALDLDFEDHGWKELSDARAAAIHEVHVDFSSADSTKRGFQEIDGTPHVVQHLVNYAVIYHGRILDWYSNEEIQRVVSTNLTGAIHCVRRFVKLKPIIKEGGSIINMSSIAGQEGSMDPVYGCTKAGLIGLTKCLARSLAPDIRVNAIAPGVVETETFKTFSDEKKNDYLSGDLIQQPILPGDVASTVAFLLSDQGRHYTGAVFDLKNGSYFR